MRLIAQEPSYELMKRFAWHSHDRHQLAWAADGVLTVVAETHTWVPRLPVHCGYRPGSSTRRSRRRRRRCERCTSSPSSGRAGSNSDSR